MAYEVFARKYRPKTWEDVVGQEAAVKALRRAVASRRTASVYLFAGSHGVGKTSVARILAKALSCPASSAAGDGAPCGTCETCLAIERGEHLDVVEIDAASHRSVEDAERLRENVRYKPASSPFKVYILDEVHQLSRQAFDALLKTFEEAPPLVRFVLATTELHKVPATILGRAQVFRFRRAGLADIAKRLGEITEREGLSVSQEALRAIARRARGSLRDSQKLLDQVVALAAGEGAGRKIEADDVRLLLGDAGPERVARCLAAIAEGRPGPLLDEVAGHLADGGRLESILQDLLEALRGVLYVKVAGRESPLLEDVALGVEDLAPAAEALSQDAVLLALEVVEDATQRMKQSREPRALVEAVLVRLSRAKELRPIGELFARLEGLEARLRGEASPPRSSGESRAAPSAGTQAPPERRPAYGYPKTAAPRGGTDAPPRTHGGPPNVADAGGGPSPGRAPSPSSCLVAVLPAPGPGPSTAAPGPDEPAGRVVPQGLTLERLAAAWPEVRARGAGRSELGLSKLLERAMPVACSSGRARVLVDVRELAGFISGWIDRPETQGTIEEIVRQVTGERVEVKLERGSAPAAPAAPGTLERGAPGPASAKPRSVYDEPIVRFTQRELGSSPLTD